MKKLAGFIIIFILIHQAFGQAPMVSRKPFVLGYTEVITSRLLNENRTLNIYLPPGYNEKDSVRYPVVYMLDGSADEDFIHLVGLYQFNNFPWIDRVPASIIVGIANVDRRRDFTFPTTLKEDLKLYPTTGHSNTFIQFLEKELQPYISAHYKTNLDRTLIGQSLAGLLATQVLLEKPALFNTYIIISPSLWWDDGSLLKHPATALKNNTEPAKIYIGVGKEGLTPGIPVRVMEVDANALVGKLHQLHNKNLKLFFDYLPEEDHATITHQAVFNALRLLNPDKNKKL
ncbi:MAG: alpha/beta hydrolase-fold protein [Ferruginibacter sp.]